MKRALIFASILLIAGTAFAVTPGTDQYLPSVGHGQGTCVNGICSQWRSDAWVFNPSTTQSASVTIYFLLRGNINATPLQAGPFTVAPRETKQYIKIVNSLFSQDGVYGALRFVSNLPLVVTGRIYNENSPTPNGIGTAGMLFDAIPAGAAVGSGGFTDLFGLGGDAAAVRCAFGFVEVTGNPATVTVQQLDPLGTPVGNLWTYTTLGGRGAQQFRLDTTLGTPAGPTNQRLRVSVTGGTGKIVAYGTVTDQRTGDSFQIDMTTSGGATPTTGIFEGVSGKIDDTVGGDVDGGIRVVIGASAVTETSGVAGIQCTSGPFTLDWAVPTATITLNPDGSFSGTFAQPYTDGVNPATIFTTTWTITGARNADGTYGGTLKSTTAGGTGQWAECNDAVQRSRPWRAGWTGNS